MSFDWLDPTIPRAVRASFPGKAKAAGLAELRERAALLRRLGRARKEVAAHLRAAVAWEWELCGASPVAGEIERVVGEVFGRG